MENPARQSAEPTGPAEDPPPPTSTSGQDQSRSESLLDSTADSTSQKRPPPPPSPLTGCYLLIVVGEPHSDRHKEIILQKIAKGFLSWDVNECHVNLEKELQAITVQSPEGEEGRYGERLIQYATENLVTEILIHPQLNTLHQCMRNLLSSFTKHRHIVHAGYTFAGNGSWILQDGTLSISDLVEALHETEVLRVLKAYENSVSIDIHCAAEGDWTTERFQREPVSKLCNIRINPDDVMTAGDPAVSAFIDYLAPFLVPANIQLLLQPTDVVGNIRFTHPTLYVFPGGQGDAALFGINGFNMLVDGGFARKACFWDFARHLDRLDAVLLTRLNNSTVSGISSVLQRKKMNHVYPQIGHFFCNLQDRKIALSPDGDKDKDSLIVNLAEEGQEIVANLRHLALKPHPCYRDGNQVDPVNLYHKVGHGKLDMYVISPARDSQAVKEFLSKWNANDNQLFSNTGKKIGAKGFDFPLQNLVSICALLVWQPANPNDTITRILFPGSTPQHKIFEGLDKLRHLEFLKHPICSARSISPSASTITVTRSLSKTRQPQAEAKVKSKAAAESKPKDLKPLEQKQKPLARPLRKADRSPPKDVKGKTDTNKLVEDKKETEKLIEKPAKMIEGVKKVEDGISNLINKDEQIEKIEKEIQKIEQEQVIQKIEEDIKKIEQNGEEIKKVIHKSKYDLKNVKSKVDSRAPSKSIDRKKLSEKKADSGSPPTTPKKSLVNGTSNISAKVEKSKPASTPKPSKSSPNATPAKSAKEANNRKVVEARVVSSRASSISRTTSRPPKKEETPPPAPASNTSAKTERKPISRRPKAPSPAKKTPASPVKPTATAKSVKTDQDVIKKVKRKLPVDLEKPATDSTVSTPSAEADITSSKKEVQEHLNEPETLAQDAKTDADDFTEKAIKSKDVEKSTENIETDEQAVKNEINKKIEKELLTNKLSQESTKTGESEKSIGGDVPEEEEEYLIITKEESTEESGKGEESEKENENENDNDIDNDNDNNNESLQEDIETKDETEGEGETKKIMRDEEDSEKRRKIQNGGVEESVEETEKDEKVDETTQRIEEIETKTRKSPEQETRDIDLSRESKSALREEVHEIIESAEEAAKAVVKDVEELEKKFEGEGSEESPHEKSSDRRDNQTKESELQKLTDLDEGIDLKEPISKEHKEGESLPDEKFSTTVETSATTAPTLPEDERMEEPTGEDENKVQLDEIKEVVEEKYIKEETKEDKPEEVKSKIEQPSTLPKAASPPVVPTQETAHHKPHPRDIVKTPDEVADLPVHEEVDPGMYSSGEFTKDLHQKHEDKMTGEKQDDKSKESKSVPSKETSDHERTPDFKETVKGEAILLDDEDTEETRKLDNADKTLESLEEKLEEDIVQMDPKCETPIPEKVAEDIKTVPGADALTSKYLDIIDKLEKTSETADNLQDEKHSFPERNSKISAINKEESPKESLVAPIDIDEGIQMTEKEISQLSVRPVQTIPTTTIVPENVRLEKELLENNGSSLNIKEPAEDVIHSHAEITTSVSAKRESKDSIDAIPADKLPSRESTPAELDEDTKQPASTPIERDRLSSGKTSPETEHKLEKSNDANKTVTPIPKESFFADKSMSVGTVPPEKTGEVTSNLENKNISERESPCFDGKMLSGKNTPDLQGSSGKTTPTIGEKFTSEKTSPLLDDKESTGETIVIKDGTAAEQSKPISINEKILAESVISGNDLTMSSSSTEKIEHSELPPRSPTPSGKIASGKSSPTKSDKMYDKVSSGKTTPAASEKDLSGKSTPNAGEKITSGKSTPDQLKKESFDKMSTDFPDETELDKVVHDKSGKDHLLKTSPSNDEKTVFGNTSPVPDVKDASGKSTPAPPENSVSAPLDKDRSGKTTSPSSNKQASGEACTMENIASPTALALSDKDISPEGTVQSDKENLTGTCEEKDTKNASTPFDKPLSEKKTTSPTDMDISGKVTSSPSEKGSLGKLANGEMDKDVSSELVSGPSAENESGKSTPAILEKISSGETTPDVLEKKTPTEKATSVPLDKESSGKITPQSEKGESCNVTQSPSPAPSDKGASGKITPQSEKGESGKVTPSPSPAPSDKEASGKITPASEKGESGKVTPSPSPAPSDKGASGKITPASEKGESGTTTPIPAPASSDKSTPGKITPTSETRESGHVTPAASDKDTPGKITPTSEKRESGHVTPNLSDKGTPGKITPTSEKGESSKVTPSPTFEKRLDNEESAAIGNESPVLENVLRASNKDIPEASRLSLIVDESKSHALDFTAENAVKSELSSRLPSAKEAPSNEEEKVVFSSEKVIAPLDLTSPSLDQNKQTEPTALSSGKTSPALSSDKKFFADGSGKNTPSEKVQSGKSTPLEKLTNGLGICNHSDELEKGILESERQEKESHLSVDISSDEEEELKALQHVDDNEDSEPEEEITRERLQSLAHSEVTAATPDSVPESPATKIVIESDVGSESPKLDAERTQKEVLPEVEPNSKKLESPLAVQKDKKDDLNALVKSGASEENENKAHAEPENHAAVKRMLVTASSEDGGTETEICAHGSIKLSKSETVAGEYKDKHESSQENSDVDDAIEKEEFSSLILQARKEYNLQRSRKSSCNSPDRQSPDDEKDPSRKSSREEQASPNQPLTEGSTDTISTEQSSVIQKFDLNGSADQTSSSVAKTLSKTKTTSRSETSMADEADIITITTILTEEREEQEDGSFLVTTTKEVVTKGGKDAGTVVTVNTDIIGSDGASFESSPKTEMEGKTAETVVNDVTDVNAESEEPLSPLSVTSQISASPSPGFDFDDYRRSACHDFNGEAAEERKSSTSSTIAFTETQKISEEKISEAEIVTKLSEEAENKDISRKSSTGSQDEKRTNSKEESEVRLSQGDQDISQREESRRTSASSTISQEDLVSRKDSTRIEELRTSSLDLSPLKTTYITSQTSSETGESQLMTSSFYGALPTEDEMILSASYTAAKSDVSSEIRKGKGYESVTEIGPDGEKTERTYFYSTEPEVSMSSSFYMKGIPEPIPEAPEITPEKTSTAEIFPAKDSFLPEEHMDFARAVDEHRSARGEDLSKSYQYDLGKYSNGKSTPPSKQEEKLTERESTKGESSTSEIKKDDTAQKDPVDKEKKDVIEGWGKPLGLPLPPKNTKATIFPGQNISTTSSLSTPSDNSDSITNWGQPMSLPSPAPPASQNGTTDSTVEKSTSIAKGTPKKEKKQVQAKKNVNDNKSSGNNTPNRRSESPVKPTEKRAPSLGRNNKSSNAPIYLDLTYVPHHGNSYYSNVEFFKRIRARYYVFSGTEPSKEVYNALLEAKQTWDDKDLEVTIIPTYDTDVLGYWVAENEEVLAKHKIDLSPSASRCTINLQDHETSCSAYRLEF